MPTLNLDLDFIDHPKVKRLIARTGSDGVVCLIRLWGHVGKFHKVDGSLSEYTNDEIEQFAGWNGEKGALLQALLDVKLIDKDLSIHDWQEHAGHLAAYQSKAKKMARAKWDAVRNAPSIAPSNTSSDASSVQFSSMQCSSVQEVKHPATPDSEKPDYDQIRQDGIRLGQVALTRRYKGGNDDAMRLTAMIWNQYSSYNLTPEMFKWIVEAKIIPHCNDVRHCLAYAKSIGDVKGEHASEARKFLAVAD